MRIGWLFLHRMRVLAADWRMFLILLVMPLFLSAVAGNALDRTTGTNMRLMVVDADDTPESRALLAALVSKEGLVVERAAEAAALRLVEDNQAEACLLVPEGYGVLFREGAHKDSLRLVTAASADSRGYLVELVAGEVFRLSGERFTVSQYHRQFGNNEKERDAATDAELGEQYRRISGEDWLEVRYDVLEARAPASGTVNYPASVASSLGLVVLFLLFGMLFGTGWMVEDRQNGTLARLLVAQGQVRAWFVGNWLALMAIGTAMAVLLMGGAWWMAGHPPVRGFASWVLLLCYIACLASLCMLLSTVFSSARQLQAATPAIAILSGFAGGCLWNQMGMVAGLPWVALMTPQGWVLQALGRMYADPDGGGWVRAALVLGLSALLMGLAGLARLRTRSVLQDMS